MGPRRRAQRRARTVAVAAALLALVVAGSVGALTLASRHGATPRGSDRGGARSTPPVTPNTAPAESSTDPVPLTIPDSAYAYPAGALFVAPGGNDNGAGTIGDPFATVGHAIAAAPSGGTIVLRAGVYREALGAIGKPITLQPYPHEQAWLAGSVAVQGWTPVSNAWAHTGWTTQFCQACFDPRAITAAYPNAGLPDMVFVNGHPLAQVTTLAAVGPGKFFVDYTAQTLYVGDDPTASGAVVESAAQSQALMLQPGAAGSVVRGVGFEEYAPAWNSWPNPAMVVDNNAPNVVFERDAFVRSASRGLTVYAAGVKVTDSLFVDNGMVGLHANMADHLDVERNVFARNNNEHFAATNAVASSAGIKVTTSGWVTIAHNVAEDNYASGIWCDLSCHDMQIVDNLARRNDQNGIDVEVSGLGIVASNVAAQNGGDGLKLIGTTDTRSYNNTLVDNAGHALGVYDDGRRNTDANTRALGITWQPARNSLYNNVLAAPAAATVNPLLFTQDNDRPVVDDAATMITALDRNVYARASSTAPATLALWIHPGSTPAGSFASLSALRAATGDEASGIELTGPGGPSLFRNRASGDYTIAPDSPAAGSGAPLPTDVAAAVGVPSGTPVDRGALVAPLASPSSTTTTVTTASVQLPASATVGVAVTNAAALALPPTGTVTLVDATTGSAIASTPLDPTGQAWFTATLHGGHHDLSAAYNGDRDDLTSGATASMDVASAATTTTIAVDVGQAVVGQTVTFTGHVATAAPLTVTGSVAFSDGGQLLGSAPVDPDGDATFATNGLAIGPHTVSAAYGGDGDNAASTDTTDATVTVAKAATQSSLTASPLSAQDNEPITLQVNVGVVQPGAGVPTGAVSFFDGATKLADATLDGTGAASVVVGPLPDGDHSLTVEYAGDDNFDASSSGAVALDVTPRRTTTVLVPSDANPVFGEAVTLTAHVADDAGPVSDGVVTFTDSATTQVLGATALDANGDAALSTSTLPLGAHTVTAAFGGNVEGDGRSSAPADVVVGPAGVVIDAAAAPSSVVAGGTIAVQATVSVANPGNGTPAGVVHVDDATAGRRLGDLTLDAGGTAAGNFAAGAVGAHTLTLSYGGSDDFKAGTASAGYVVVPASTTTVASADTTEAVYGQTITLRAAVAGGTLMPSGTVQFSDGGSPLGQAQLDGTGTAAMSVSTLAVGSHTIVASYSGDGNDTASDSSASPLTVTVGPAPTATALTADVLSPAHGQAVTFTVHVTGAAPSGSVTLLDGATPLGTATALAADGTATISTASLPVGAHVITASYGGDANHAPSDSSAIPVTIAVKKASSAASVVASQATTTVGVPVTLTATVAVVAPGQGVPTGTVTFADGTVVLASAVALDASAQARVTVSSLPVGARGITASYSGDASTAASVSNPVSVTVTRRTPTVLITSALPSSISGQSVTFTASVIDGAGAVADGSIAFGDATNTPPTVLATVPLDATGHASFTTSSLPVGARTISARYLGGGADAAAGPATLTQTVGRAHSATGLTITPSTSSAGTPVTFTASVAVAAPGRATPTGTVTFLDGASAVGSPVALDANKQAVLTTTALAAGSHQIAAVYSGDASVAPSTSAVVPVTVAARPTTVASASPSVASVYGQAVTLSVNVLDPLGAVTTGSVVFRDTFAGSTVPLGTAAVDAAGRAQLAVTFRRVGAHSITARFGGTATDAPSRPATLVQNVGRASAAVAVRLTPVTVAPGGTVTLAVTVRAVAPGSGTPAGSFTVDDGTTPIAHGTLVASSGAQALTFHPLSNIGPHSIVVITAGNAAFLPAKSAPAVVTVKRRP